MRNAIRSPLLALALIAIFAGTVLATTASGFTATLLSRGAVSDPVHSYNTREVKLKTKAPVDVATASVTIDPLGSSGWHEHPGIVLVTVKSGTVTFYRDNCSPTTYAPGTSFIETFGNGPGLARNESSTTPAVLYATYIVPTGAALRIDAANPGCSQS